MGWDFGLFGWDLGLCVFIWTSPFMLDFFLLSFFQNTDCLVTLVDALLLNVQSREILKYCRCLSWYDGKENFHTFWCTLCWTWNTLCAIGEFRFTEGGPFGSYLVRLQLSFYLIFNLLFHGNESTFSGWIA